MDWAGVGVIHSHDGLPVSSEGVQLQFAVPKLLSTVEVRREKVTTSGLREERGGDNRGATGGKRW